MPRAPTFLAYLAATLLLLGWTEPWAPGAPDAAPVAVAPDSGGTPMVDTGLPVSDCLRALQGRPDGGGALEATEFRTLVAKRLQG